MSKLDWLVSGVVGSAWGLLMLAVLHGTYGVPYLLTLGIVLLGAVGIGALYALIGKRVRR